MNARYECEQLQESDLSKEQRAYAQRILDSICYALKSYVTAKKDESAERNISRYLTRAERYARLAGFPDLNFTEFEHFAKVMRIDKKYADVMRNAYNEIRLSSKRNLE